MRPGGKLNRSIDRILFDIYGTLFVSDSGDIGVTKVKNQKQHHLKELLEKYDLKLTPERLLQTLYARIEKIHGELRKEGIDFPEVEIDKIWMHVLQSNDRHFVQQFAIEFEMTMNPVYPMPHLKEVLSALKHRRLLMGIISNAQFFTPYLFEWFLGSDLKHLGIHPNLTILSYQLKHAKPSAILFDLAVQRLSQLDVHSASVLYIGNDMLNDIYPAKKSGLKTGLFAGDARSLRLRENHPSLKDLSADLVITDLIQILDYI